MVKAWVCTCMTIMCKWKGHQVFQSTLPNLGQCLWWWRHGMSVHPYSHSPLDKVLDFMYNMDMGCSCKDSTASTTSYGIICTHKSCRLLAISPKSGGMVGITGMCIQMPIHHLRRCWITFYMHDMDLRCSLKGSICTINHNKVVSFAHLHHHLGFQPTLPRIWGEG